MRLESIFNVFLSIPNLRIARTGNIYIGSKSHNPAKFKVFWDYIGKDKQKDLLVEYPQELAELLDGSNDYKFSEYLISKLKEKKENELAQSQDLISAKIYDQTVIFDEANPIPLNLMRYKSNVEDQNSCILFHPEKETAYKVDPRHFQSRLKFHIPDDEQRAVWLATHMDNRIIKYQPFKPKDFTTEDGRGAFNTWNIPAYMKDFTPAPGPNHPPQDLAKIVDHLFTIPNERPFVYSWLKKVLFYRESTVLLLSGAPGSGKGVLAEHFLRQIVGEDNWTKAAANFNDSQFHGEIRGVQAFFLNEIKLKQAAKEKLKDFADGRATLSEKFLANRAAEPIHASFIVANNYPHENWLEFSDRKFFVPTLNNIKLDEVYGRDWVTHFCEVTCKDTEFLRSVYNYLQFHVELVNDYPKTPKFYEICEMCLPAYLKRFLLFCKKRKEFTEKDVLRGFKGKAPTFYELQHSLEVYQKETRQDVAVMSETVTGWTARSLICVNEDSDEVV